MENSPTILGDSGGEDDMELRRSGGRILARRHATDRLQAGLLPAGPRAFTLPSIVSAAPGESLRRGQAAVLLRLAGAERPQSFPALSGAAAKGRLGSLRQAARSAGPKQVLDYVGRYTHRVAISNNRLVEIEDGRCAFAGRIIGTAIGKRS